jgi:hypothetical protein
MPVKSGKHRHTKINKSVSAGKTIKLQPFPLILLKRRKYFFGLAGMVL